nr:MAG TPA: hypothetical protein [Caudoviricetes sp.]
MRGGHRTYTALRGFAASGSMPSFLFFESR